MDKFRELEALLTTDEQRQKLAEIEVIVRDTFLDMSFSPDWLDDTEAHDDCASYD